MMTLASRSTRERLAILALEVLQVLLDGRLRGNAPVRRRVMGAVRRAIALKAQVVQVCDDKSRDARVVLARVALGLFERVLCDAHRELGLVHAVQNSTYVYGIWCRSLASGGGRSWRLNYAVGRHRWCVLRHVMPYSMPQFDAMCVADICRHGPGSVRNRYHSASGPAAAEPASWGGLETRGAGLGRERIHDGDAAVGGAGLEVLGVDGLGAGFERRLEDEGVPVRELLGERRDAARCTRAASMAITGKTARSATTRSACRGSSGSASLRVSVT